MEINLKPYLKLLRLKDAWKEADKLLAKSKAKERLVEEINLFFTHRASAGSEGKEESEAFFTLHCDSGSRRDKSLLRPPSFRRKRR